MECYLNSKNQYLSAQKQLEVSFDLQWVSDLLTDSVRRAGFTPCLSLDNLQVIDRREGLQHAITSIRIDNKLKQLIQINRMSEWFVPVVRILNPTQILIPKSIAFNLKRPIIIADCEHAEIHQLAGIEILPRNYLITLAKPMLFSYEQVAYCGEWLEEQWFIKKNTKGTNALYYHAAQTEELTTHIHALEVNSQWVHGKRLFEINLHLDEDKTKRLVVAVRGS